MGDPKQFTMMPFLHTHTHIVGIIPVPRLSIMKTQVYTNNRCYLFIYFCVCFCFYAYAMARVWRSGGNFGQSFFPYQAGPEDWTQDVRFGHSLYSQSHDFPNNWCDFMNYFRLYLLCSECFNHDLAKHLTNNQEIVADSAQWTIPLCNALASSTPTLQPDISSQRWAVSPNKNRNLIKTVFFCVSDHLEAILPSTKLPRQKPRGQDAYAWGQEEKQLPLPTS